MLLATLAAFSWFSGGATNSWSVSDYVRAATINGTGLWETVPGLTLMLASDESVYDYMISYSISLQAYRALGGHGNMSRGILQMRLVVDDVPYREGSTHAQAALRNAAPAYATIVTGYLHLPLQHNRTHLVLVQWKASSTDVVWRSDPTQGDGFASGRVLMATRYLNAWSHVAAVASIYSHGSDWALIPDSSLNFSTMSAEHVQFSYCVTVHAELSTNPWEAQDELLLRLVVDGRAYPESVEIFANREYRVSSSGTIQRSIVLYLGPGAHTVELEWKKSQESSAIVFRSDPFMLDGFASSRGLYAIADQHGVDAVKHLQSISVHSGQKAPRVWATLSTKQFELANFSTVLVDYALPVFSTNLSDFDAWSYDLLSGVSARLLIDGAPYREAGSSIGGYTQKQSSLHGHAVLDLPPGSHTTTLQWHASTEGGQRMWEILTRFAGLGISGGLSLITITEMYRQQLSVVIPTDISLLIAREDEVIAVAGIQISGIDSAVFVEVSITARHGNVSLDQTNSSRSASASGTAADVNQAIRIFFYSPFPNYSGNDTISIEARADFATNQASFSLEVIPVNDEVVIVAPESLSLDLGSDSTSLDKIVIFDPDADTGNPEYLLTIVALWGYIIQGRTEHAFFSTYFESSGSLANINSDLSTLSYLAKPGLSSAQIAELITVVVTDLEARDEDPGQNSSVQIRVDSNNAHESSTIIAPSYWEMAIYGLAVQNADPAATLTLNVLANAEATTLSLVQGASTFGVAANLGADGRKISLTGSASNVSVALQSMIYVREPLFYGPDIIEATLYTTGDFGLDVESAASISVGIHRAARKHFRLSNVVPLRGPTSGGTLLRFIVSTEALSNQADNLYCQFGTLALTVAQFISTKDPGIFDSSCVSPPARENISSPMFVPLHLTNKVDILSEAIFFLYEPLQKIKINPSFGPAAGGTAVQIFASSSILPSENQSCLILGLDNTSAFVAAHFVNASTFMCIMPAVGLPKRSPAPYSLSLSTNSRDSSSEFAEFVYIPATKITSLAHMSGPQQGGSTLLFGGHYLTTLPYMCRFCVLSSTSVSCIDDYGAVHNRSALTCLTPARWSDQSDAVTVGVSLDHGSTFKNVANFSFWRSTNLLSCSPSFGPKLGGTRVIIKSDGYPAKSGIIRCLFGNSEAAIADVISNQEIRCTSPPHAAGSTNITVSLDHVVLSGTKNTLGFEYFPEIVLEKMQPRIGGLQGGTSVLVSGQNFPDKLQLKCQFGNVEALAWLVNASLVECKTPRYNMSGPVHVKVGDSHISSTNRLAFLYYNPIEVGSLTPANGPTKGGTIITVYGKNFAFTPKLHCRIGSMNIPAAFVTSRQIRCTTPAHEVAHVSVAVTPNLQDYVQAAVLFSYELPLVITSVKPSLGPTAGGTVVALTMSNALMPISSALKCIFGDAEGLVVSDFSLDRQIWCMSPPHLAMALPVGISTNGVDYYKSSGLYRYVLDPKVLALSPASGIITGNFVVLVRGLNFLDTSKLMCRFGREYAVGRFIDGSEIECIAPRGRAGHVAVEVSLNSVEFTNNGASFEYFPPPVLKEMTPLYGPTRGGTEVRIVGSSLRFTPDARCRFGWIDVPASFASEEEVRCQSPPRSTGFARVSLLENGRNVSNFSAAFEYQEPASASRVVPTHGTAEGGTAVSIHGSGFLSARAMSCAFGEVVIAARMVSARVIECITPAYEPGIVDLTIRDANGLMVGLIDLRYEFVVDPRVTSLHPRIGLTAGGTSVRVFGSYFVQTGDLHCRFGHHAITLARWLSPTEIACKSPPGAAGAVPVEISLNGQEYTGDHIQFSYVDVFGEFRINPTFGPTRGGTEVTITGDNFQLLPNLACHFADNRAPATFIDRYTVKCVSPFHHPGATLLNVSINDQESRPIGTFTFHPEISLHSIEPPIGTTSGGTLVVLNLSGPFFESDTAVCFFGHQSVKASHLDQNRVVCASPPQMEGVVLVSVSLNGIDGSINTQRYQYFSDPYVLSLFPASGPSSGGTVVQVRGVNFKDSDIVKCRFGNQTVAALWLSSTVIDCKSPTHSPRAVPVALTYNEQEVFECHSRFKYTKGFNNLTIRPTSGPASGGIDIEILGSDFSLSDDLACRFDGKMVPVALIGKERLACVLPPHEPAEVLVFLTSGVYQHLVAAFVYWPDLFIISCEPCFGSISGGTEISMRTSTLPAAINELSCVFGGVESTKGIILSPEEVLCKTPPHQAGLLSLNLCFDGKFCSMNEAPFQFLGAAILEWIDPKMGAITGRSRVVASGINIPDIRGLSCYFDSCKVPASWINSTHVECDTPQHDEGTPTFRLGTDHWSTVNGLQFTYVPQVEVTDVTPTRGPTNGGTIITVRGSSFVLAPGLHCRFGWIDVPAVFISTSEILCTTPPHKVAQVLVAVTLNLYDYVYSASPFAYEMPVVITSFQPSIGPTNGGTIVALTMSSVLSAASSDISCKFGEAVGRFVSKVSPTLVHCMSPPHSAASLSISISINGVACSKSSGMYQYAPDPKLLELSPASGPVAGNVVVLIRGLNFVDSGELQCRFGPEVATARFINTDSIECTAPSGRLGRVTVEVSLNGIDYSHDSALFEYFVESELRSIVPLSGPISGGTEVRIIGYELRFTPDTKCRFGWIDVAATFTNAEEVRCRSPPRTKGNADFALLQDGRYVSNVSYVFEYREPVTTSRIVPTYGLSDGGAVISVYGSGFSSVAPNMSCTFGDFVQPARVISATKIECTAPAHEVGYVEFTVRDGNQLVEGLNCFHFEFVRRPRVVSIHPRFGILSGGNSIRVFGSNFIETNHLCCRFGGHALSWARWVHPTEVVCESPPGLAGTLPVEVSVNGQEFTADGIEFTYVDSTGTFSVEPTTGPSSGGTEVVVVSLHLQFGTNLTCRFGEVSVFANWIDEASLNCILPPLHPGLIELALLQWGHIIHRSSFDILAPAEIYFAPAVGPSRGKTIITLTTSIGNLPAGLCCHFSSIGVTKIEYGEKMFCLSPPAPKTMQSLLKVGPCNQSWHETVESSLLSPASKFTFHTPIAIYNLIPRVVLASSDKEVRIIGSGFVDSVGLSCKIVNTIIPARWHSESSVACLPPLDAGTAYIQVSNNGQDFTNLQASGNLVKVIPEIVLNYVASRISKSDPVVDIYGGFSMYYAEKVMTSTSYKLYTSICQVMCTIDDSTAVVGHYRSPSHVQCPIPRLDNLTAEVRVCYEGIGCSRDSCHVALTLPPMVESIEPRIVTEGTMIRLIGNVSSLRDVWLQFTTSLHRTLLLLTLRKIRHYVTSAKCMFNPLATQREKSDALRHVVPQDQ